MLVEIFHGKHKWLKFVIEVIKPHNGHDMSWMFSLLEVLIILYGKIEPCQLHVGDCP